jgi:nucleotide sugar dehydrogenase
MAATPGNVAVVGLGKIGLPLAAYLSQRGANVFGCDINAEVVAAVNEGVSPILGEPGLEAALEASINANRLEATTDTTAAVRESDVVIIVVPVGIDAEQHTNYEALDAAAQAIGRGLRPGTLVILESTVPVGATRGRLRRRLMAASGLRDEGSFLLAYSPERVSSGTMFRDLSTYPKLVGGTDAASGEAAAAFYRGILDAEVRLLPDAETAEFAKLAESVYRDVNIALANELARTAESLGIDYQEAAAAANSQPYSHLHVPGLGVGGHCIPVYPYFLIEVGEQRLLTTSRQINDGMADHGATVLDGALKQETGEGLRGCSVLVLGLAYRGGVKEATLSSTLLLAEALEGRGARVLVHDPLFTHQEIYALGLTATALPPEEPVEAVILQADHAEYRALDLTQFGCRVVLDGRRALDQGQVEAAGIRYLAIGLGR